MRAIKKIIIHESDSTWGTEREIVKWHKRKGWSDCGYHFVINNGHVKPKLFIASMNGQVEMGRNITQVGAHCYGHNKYSIGICLIGKGGKHTVRQKNELRKLIMTLIEMFPEATVHGHYEFDNGKTCPTFDVQKWYYRK